MSGDAKRSGRAKVDLLTFDQHESSRRIAAQAVHRQHGSRLGPL
jgi:hypothetical protein